ncbi:hypothetical protein JCM5350_003903 [Sporobolomyces pararoseus]
MDRLPPELLGMIADSIQQDPPVLKGQQSLNTLARTSKRLYSICNPLLYRNPMLRGERSKMMEWVRFYTSKVTPWSLAHKAMDFENVPVPGSITIASFTSTTNKEIKPTPVFPRLPSPITESRLASIAFEPDLFRNLTTFSLSTPSIVDHDLLVALFGPLGRIRITICNLRLPEEEEWRLLPFLLEAHDRMRWSWDRGAFDRLLDELVDECLDEELKLSIKNRIQSYGQAVSEEEYDELEDIAHGLAPTRWSLFKSMLLDTVEPDEILDYFLGTKEAFSHPFTGLRFLSLAVEDSYELYLLFISRLLPSLDVLKLIGGIYTSINLAFDIKLLRHSITQ